MDILEIKNVTYNYSNSSELVLSKVNQKFEIGKAVQIGEGTDATIFATGVTVSEAIRAQEILENYEIIPMNEIGIDNVIVIGTGTNSSGQTENHAWNYVKLNEDWYAVDITWDDPIVIGDGILPEKSKYQYFLKGSETMNQNHVTSGKFTDAGQVFTYPTLSKNDYE